MLLETTVGKSFTVNQKYYLKSPPKRVFAALSDPRMLRKWFLSKAKVEGRTGGKYEFSWIGGYHMDGNVKRFQSDKTLVYSWHDKLSKGNVVETTAAFSVERKGTGTLLKLRHSGFTDPEHYAECSSRWAYYLTNLKSVLDSGTDLRSKYDW